jgi:urease accessory protein
MNALSQPLRALASQRVDGEGRLVIGHAHGRARLRELFQRGAAKIRLPTPEREAALEAVLINTAGGLTGGDRLAWIVEVGEDCAVVVTTQASEKVYRAGGGMAEVRVGLELGDNSLLAWLPQETILFDRSAVGRKIDATMTAGARLLLAEATVFGRTARGERVEQGHFADRWRVRVDGKLVHAEDFRIGPATAQSLATPAVLNGGVAIATVLLVAEDAASLLDEARGIVGAEGGVSHWMVAGHGKLLARLHAADGYSLRKRLVPLLALLNNRAALPKAWSL